MTLQSQDGFGGLPSNVAYDVLVANFNRLLIGRLNAFKDVTLTANSATTTVKDPRIGANTALLFMPQTANAAAGLSALYVPAATLSKGQAVIQHANNAQTDRTYRILIIG